MGLELPQTIHTSNTNLTSFANAMLWKSRNRHLAKSRARITKQKRENVFVSHFEWTIFLPCGMERLKSCWGDWHQWVSSLPEIVALLHNNRNTVGPPVTPFTSGVKDVNLTSSVCVCVPISLTQLQKDNRPLSPVPVHPKQAGGRAPSHTPKSLLTSFLTV